MQEDRWYNPATRELAVSEIWYRRWERAPVIKTPNERVVGFDESNLAHAVAVQSGLAKVQMATLTRIRRAYWLGPHRLHDGPSSYMHRHFPYVPMWGFREDTTGVPYGFVRGMKYAQDSLNSGNSKLRWGMSVARVERTKGAVAMSDAQLRRQVARPDADIVLDASHMAQSGARFEVKRDYQLSNQHYQMLMDNRQAISRVSGITDSFMGKESNATSGIQEQTQVEQSNQSVASIMDNFWAARKQVGELLLAMIIADRGEKEDEILIEGDAITDDKVVKINHPEVNPVTGLRYLSNDLMRTKLKVTLEEVPSTINYRAQQLQALTEAIKPLPGEYLAAAIPFLTSLMDVPFKRDLVEAFRAVSERGSPEQVKQRIEQAIKEALAKSDHDIKARKVALEEQKAGREIKKLDAESVQIGVQAAFSAMQAGAQIAEMPMIAPVADAVMQSAGYRRPVPPGVDPQYPVPAPAATAQAQQAPPVDQNTSPQFPPVPDQAGTGQRGIETATTDDNLPQ